MPLDIYTAVVATDEKDNHHNLNSQSGWEHYGYQPVGFLRRIISIYTNLVNLNSKMSYSYVRQFISNNCTGFDLFN